MRNPYVHWGQHATFLRDNWLTLGVVGCASALSEQLGHPVTAGAVQVAVTKLRKAGVAIPLRSGGRKPREDLQQIWKAERKGVWTVTTEIAVQACVAHLITQESKVTGMSRAFVALRVVNAAIKEGAQQKAD